MDGKRPPRFGLQAWLVAAFVAIGAIASIAVALVVLPTLEGSIREEQTQEAARDLYVEIRDAQPFQTRTYKTQVENLALKLGGQVRFVWLDTDGVLADSAPPNIPAGTLPPPGTLSKPAKFVHDSGLSRSYEPVTIAGGLYIQAGHLVKVDSRPNAALLDIAVPVKNADGQIAIFRRRTLLATGLALVLACLAGIGIARLLGSRIRGLATTAHRLAAGDLSARAEETSPQELSTLSASLNAMAARLEDLVAEAVSDRDRARALVASLSEAVIAVSDRGAVTVANAAAERLLDLPHGSDDITTADLPAPVREALAASREQAGAPVEATLPSGIEVLISAAPLTRGGGVVLTLRDVTAERRLTRARRDLIANVSHELKTPLTAVKGFMELLERPDLDPERRAQFIDLMSQEVARLERLVAEQLELARLDAGALTLERQSIDLGDLATDVAASRQLLAEREGITLVASPAAEAVVVNADPARVEQILLILLDNAIKHTAGGGKITVGVGHDDRYGTLTVRDTGSGIPRDALPFVFDRFYQADTSREGQGLGLGLAIARGLADAHGGSIEVQSAPQIGSAFTVRLPLTATGAAHPTPTTEASTVA